MQLLLHPSFKDLHGLSKVVKICNEQSGVPPVIVERNVSAVKTAVCDRVRKLMLTVVVKEKPKERERAPPRAVFSEELMEMFAAAPAPPPAAQEAIQVGRADEELERWIEAEIALNTVASGTSEETTESILEFWRRQSKSSNYSLLPMVARIVFAVPTSSAQIERDFGVSGMMVTTQRSSIAAHNVDMCSFLNRNKSFIDVTQCPKLTTDVLVEHIPSNVLVNLQTETEVEGEDVLARCFSDDDDEEEAYFF